jgi:hypothetical protein
MDKKETPSKLLHDLRSLFAKNKMALDMLRPYIKEDEENIRFSFEELVNNQEKAYKLFKKLEPLLQS